MRETCTLAVFSAMQSCAPIWRLVAPRATSESTWRSRGVRPKGSSAGVGAPWLRGEAEGLAGRARLALATVDEAPPSVTAGEDPFGLTPRERQVLALLADCRTNREIGQTLYMAEKTASVHVSRILSKLDVRSRTEAAALAHRVGLV